MPTQREEAKKVGSAQRAPVELYGNEPSRANRNFSNPRTQEVCGERNLSPFMSFGQKKKSQRGPAKHSLVSLESELVADSKQRSATAAAEPEEA